MAPFQYKNEYERYKRYYQSLQPVLDKPANRAYTAIIFSFLAISLFGWYAIRPTMQTIFTLQREIKDKTDIDKKMEDKISALIEAQAAYQEIETNIPIIAEALPPIPDPARAVAQIRNLAHESNVAFNSVIVPPLALDNDPGPTKQKIVTNNKLADFVVTVSVIGAYADIKNFLEGIMDLRRIVQIDSMTFTPRRESSTTTASPSATLAAPTSSQVQLDLKLKLFYLPT